MNYQALAGQRQASRHPLSPRSDAARVLIVEPSSQLRRALVTLLRMRRLHVAEAADADGALQAAREWHPTVLVLEPRLPEVGARIIGKLHGIDPRLQVIAYTSAAPETERVLLDAGAYRVIRKGTGAVTAVVEEIDEAHGAYLAAAGSGL